MSTLLEALQNGIGTGYELSVHIKEDNIEDATPDSEVIFWNFPTDAGYPHLMSANGISAKLETWYSEWPSDYEPTEADFRDLAQSLIDYAVEHNQE